MIGAELLTPEATGWRVWEAVEVGGTYALAGPTSYRIWAPGQPMRSGPRGIAAEGTSSDGIYAYRFQNRPLAYSYVTNHIGAAATGRLYVVGRVGLWGTVGTVRDEIYAKMGYPLTLDGAQDFRGKRAFPSGDAVLELLRQEYLGWARLAQVASAVKKLPKAA